MNKGDRNVRCFSQFKNSYGKPLVIIGEKIIVLTKLSVHLPPHPPEKSNGPSLSENILQRVVD